MLAKWLSLQSAGEARYTVTCAVQNPSATVLTLDNGHPAPFVGPKKLYCSGIKEYNWGGVGLSDISEGLEYQRWCCRLFRGYIILEAEEVAPITVYSGINITECSFAFDAEMGLVLAFMDGAALKVSFYNTSTQKREVNTITTTAVSPKLLSYKMGNYDDVLLLFIGSVGELKYMKYSDKFSGPFHILSEKVHKKIRKVGVNADGRLQLSMLGVAPA